MDIEFLEPEESPRPPEEVRFRSVRARPYPHGRRVRLEIELTPFLLRPTLEIVILDAGGGELASTTVVEATGVELELTLHLRPEAPPGLLTARFTLLYPDLGPVDERDLPFHSGRGASASEDSTET